MSKSTPLNQLPNMQSSNQESENKESQLVNEILNEIESNEDNSQEKLQQQLRQQQIEQQQQQLEQQQLMQQQLEQQQIQQNNSQQEELNQKMMVDEINKRLEEDLKTEVNNSKTMMDNITDMIKQPAIVAAICIFLSIPKLNTILISFLPKKEFILNNSSLFITIFKGLMGGLLFFVLNKNL